MSIIDELVTIIRFDLPDSSSKAFDAAEAGVSSLTKHIKDLGIVSMSTGAVTAALSVNAAKNATELKKASEVTDLTTDRLQELGYIYQSVGGDAKNATQDAQAFFSTFGRRMDDKALKDLQSYIAGLSEAEANLKLANAGFSEDMRRVLALGEEEFQKRSKYAKDFHSLTKGEIEDLAELSTSFSTLTSRMGTISQYIQADLAPAFSGIFSTIEEGLNQNESTFKRWGESLKNTISGVSDGIKGDVRSLNKVFEEETTGTSGSAMFSKNKDIREENLSRLKSDTMGRTFGNMWGFATDVVAAAFTDSTVSGAWEQFVSSQRAINEPYQVAINANNRIGKTAEQLNTEALSRQLSERMRTLSTDMGFFTDVPISGSFESIGKDLAKKIVSVGSATDWAFQSQVEKDKLLMDWLSGENISVPRRNMDGVKPSLVPNITTNVTNSIAIYGNSESDFTIERLQSAVTDATTDGVKSAYKQAVPDGFIGVH